MWRLWWLNLQLDLWSTIANPLWCLRLNRIYNHSRLLPLITLAVPRTAHSQCRPEVEKAKRSPWALSITKTNKNNSPMLYNSHLLKLTSTCQSQLLLIREAEMDFELAWGPYSFRHLRVLFFLISLSLGACWAAVDARLEIVIHSPSTQSG